MTVDNKQLEVGGWKYVKQDETWMILGVAKKPIPANFSEQRFLSHIETLQQERDKWKEQSNRFFAQNAGAHALIGILKEGLASLERVREAADEYIGLSKEVDKQIEPEPLDELIPDMQDAYEKLVNESARHEREWPKEER